MAEIVIDFETGNPDAKLLNVGGAWRYAEDKRTDILCCVASPAPGELFTWAPNRRGAEKLLRDWANDPKTVFVIHGEFEIAIWEKIMVPKYRFPTFKGTWHDIMAVAATKGLPLALEHLCEALHVGVQKDMEGRSVTLALADEALRSDEAIARVIRYCGIDVEAEWAVHKKLGRLPNGKELDEFEAHRLHRKMNQRGVCLDLTYIAKAQEVVDKETKIQAARFVELTKTKQKPNGLKHTQTRELAKHFGFKNKSDKLSFDAETIAAALEDDFLTQNEKEALEIRQLINSAAVKKLPRMKYSVCADGRARGLSQFHGAHPGRSTGRLFQPYNFPRGILKDTPEDAVKYILTGNPDHVEVMTGFPALKAVASSLRHAIVPAPGHVFFAGDYRQIQARIVLALAGQTDKLDLLEWGINLYCDMAKKIYGREIDKEKDPEEYHIGKSAVLGLGFGMGWPKFKAQFAPKHTDGFCQEVVEIYRSEWAPEVRNLWNTLNHMSVIACGGIPPWRTDFDKRKRDWIFEERQKQARRLEGLHLSFSYRDDYPLNYLIAHLPSGRELFYPKPKCVPVKLHVHHEEKLKTAHKFTETEGDILTYETMQGHKMATVDLFGGKLCENIVMGMEVDIQRRGWANLEKHGYPIVMEVYDQLVAEVPEGKKELFKFAYHMTNMDEEPWVGKLGIPVEVDCWQGYRYRK